MATTIEVNACERCPLHELRREDTPPRLAVGTAIGQDYRAGGVVIVLDQPMPDDEVKGQALAGEARVVPFRELGTAAGDSVAGMLAFFDRHDMEKYGSEGAPLHDPTTVAYLIDPGLFTGRMCHVEIVRDGPAEGMTMVDWWRVTGNEPNAMVINEVDADGFFAVLLERIARL